MPSLGSMHSNTFTATTVRTSKQGNNTVWPFMSPTLKKNPNQQSWSSVSNKDSRIVRSLWNNAVKKSKWLWYCLAKSIMISALCSCQNVLVMNQMADTERTKMIGENDCYKKQTGFVIFWCVWFLYLWQIWLCFLSFTKMYSLRPSLKMLHEIF